VYADAHGDGHADANAYSYTNCYAVRIGLL
jgi:hypothetical protein